MPIAKQKPLISPAMISSGLNEEPARPAIGIKLESRLCAKHIVTVSPIVPAAATVMIFVYPRIKASV